MKTTLQPQIDVINVTEKDGVFTVSYWDENFDGENNVTMQISQEALLTFLPDANMFSNEHNRQYLSDNRDEIIKDYIVYNS